MNKAPLWNVRGVERRRESLAERLERWIERLPDAPGCWLWMGGRNTSGYGMMRICNIRNLNDRAHRVSYRVHVGEIPPGMWVLHRCDVRACVNPAHLYLGTIAENVADAVRRHRLRPPRGEQHPRRKLGLSDVEEIRRLVAAGESTRAVGHRYGLDHGYVSRLSRGLSWRTA